MCGVVGGLLNGGSRRMCVVRSLLSSSNVSEQGLGVNLFDCIEW